ncbi:MAG: right-handed parallel beta-helix repeat-containing protein, partial [Planctomycetota bacterium]|nr:right-handed parallel beta-helix repeat-containing protein [Planctomycetota bacterium]
TWYFQQLFVDGQRRPRARSPNEGFYYVAGTAPGSQAPGQGQAIAGQTPASGRLAFVFAAGEIKQWPDIADANVVVFHSWETSRHRIAKINEAEHVVTFTGPAAWPFENWGPKQRYVVENVREALDAPGEWYLERASGTLYYYPLPGEDPAKAEFVAPALTRLVELRGNPDKNQFVQYVTLRGLTFSHEDWVLEPQGHSDPQAVVTAPAALLADGARYCVIERCEVSHVGDYGLWFRRGCKHNRIVHNRLCDLGVGGVRIGEAAMPPNDETESSHNLVDNNHIFDGGHVYPAGIGVWVAQSSHNVISHNEIHDFFYSGMSIGWNWDDAPNRCHHNLIELNHVHHLVKGLLSDAGAIYTLGVSPGSIIRNNLFHDVWSYHQPPLAWGIYLDATTGGYLVENNVVYHTLSGGLMYNNGGHEHVIQNNIFALSADHQLWPFWEKRPNTFRHNIVYFTQGTFFVPYAESSLQQRLAAKESLGTWDENVYWHTGGADQLKFFRRTFAAWQALGLDGKTQIADPQFENADECDFRLKPASPALALAGTGTAGFKPIDLSNVGLYGDAEWVAEARAVKHPKTVMPAPPPPPKPTEVDDGFEKTAVGVRPEGATVSGEEKGASIRVTDEQAAGGKHSLKFTDSKDLTPTWQPHMYYEPHIAGGGVRQSFDVRMEPGSLMFTEWRDAGGYPQNVGPSVTFDGAGRVSGGGKVLATVPASTWVHIEIEAPLGKDAPRKFKLTVAVPGAAPQVFADLAMPGKEFEELHWLGFSSTAAVDSVFYVDNLRIKRTP